MHCSLKTQLYRSGIKATRQGICSPARASIAGAHASGWGKSNADARQMRDELLQLLAPRTSGRELQSTRPVLNSDVKRRVNDLIDQLAKCKLVFEESDLSGGPGVVVYTRGTLALWDAFQRPAPKTRQRDNRASQDLNSNGRTVINKAEFWGPTLYVTATGTYTPATNSQDTNQLQCPVSVKADIQKGALHWGDSHSLPLPIQGQGQFEILYCDPVMRIFRSGTTYSVQVKESYLDNDQ